MEKQYGETAFRKLFKEALTKKGVVSAEYVRCFGLPPEVEETVVIVEGLVTIGELQEAYGSFACHELEMLKKARGLLTEEGTVLLTEEEADKVLSDVCHGNRKKAYAKDPMEEKALNIRGFLFSGLLDELSSMEKKAVAGGMRVTRVVNDGPSVTESPCRAECLEQKVLDEMRVGRFDEIEVAPVPEEGGAEGFEVALAHSDNKEKTTKFIIMKGN